MKILYSRLDSQVEHSVHRLNWSNYEKRFTRLNDYVFYRLYMRKDIEKYKVERNYVPFVPSADYPDSFAVVTKRNELVDGIPPKCDMDEVIAGEK